MSTDSIGDGMDRFVQLIDSKNGCSLGINESRLITEMVCLTLRSAVNRPPGGWFVRLHALVTRMPERLSIDQEDNKYADQPRIRQMRH